MLEVVFTSEMIMHQCLRTSSRTGIFVIIFWSQETHDHVTGQNFFYLGGGWFPKIYSWNSGVLEYMHFSWHYVFFQNYNLIWYTNSRMAARGGTPGSWRFNIHELSPNIHKLSPASCQFLHEYRIPAKNLASFLSRQYPPFNTASEKTADNGRLRESFDL